MSRLLDAANESVFGTNTFVANASYSMCCWLRAQSVPQAATTNQFKVVDTSDGIPDIGFSYDHANASFRKAAFHRNAAGGYSSAILTTSLLANTWYAIGVTYDGSNLRAWLNGTNEATTGSVSVGSTQAGSLGILRSAVSGTPSNIEYEWLSFWNGVALNTDEMISYARGLEPWRIRPASLSACYPYLGYASPEIDLISGALGTVTNATKGANSSPVYRSRRQYVSVPAAAPGGDPEGPLVGGKLIRGGMLIRGRLAA